MLSQQKIETVKARNIAARENKLLKKQKRLDAKQARSKQRMEKMNSFSVSYADKREAFVNKRVAKIKEKYEIKINMADKSVQWEFLNMLNFIDVRLWLLFSPLFLSLAKHRVDSAKRRFDSRVSRLQAKVSGKALLESSLSELTDKHQKTIATLKAKVESIVSRRDKSRLTREEVVRIDEKLWLLFSPLFLSLAKHRVDSAKRRFDSSVGRLQSKVSHKALLESSLSELPEKHQKTIATLKAKVDSIVSRRDNPSLTREEVVRWRVERNPFLRYYQLRLAYLARFFQYKHAALAKKVELSRIAPEVGDEREKRLQIDEATSYLRWDKKIASIRENAAAGRTTVLINKYKTLMAAEVKAIERRKEMPPAFTVWSSVRDIFEISKSTYVGGFEIRGILNKVSAHLRRFSMYYVFASIVIIFGIATSWTNLNPENVANVIQNNLYILVIGLAMLLVILSGAIDLSVGGMLGFCGALSVYTYNLYGGNLAASIVTTLLLGLGYGLFQGFLIGYFKMPSFIVTLGGMLLFAGLSLFLTKGQTFIPAGNFDGAYVQWVVGTFETPLNTGTADMHFASFFIIFGAGLLVVISMFFGRSKRAKYGIDSGNIASFLIKAIFILGLFGALGYFIGASNFGLRYYMLYLLALVVIFMFVTQNTTFGRAIYAVGGNKRAAFLSGINVARTQMFVFAVIGLTTAFASLLYSGINISASAQSGSGFELDVISSVFVGGASMSGGIGTVAGTLIGGMTLGFINNGLYILNLGVDVQRIIRACILIGAVGYDIYTHRKIG